MALQGHPFLVEGAVSIGGSMLREGINVYRFANRIPLLFETGADVVTQVSTKRINWTNYHIDPRKDNIGVFISIVSTKVPFKGTSKEYIGDDILEIQQSVKRVIQGISTALDSPSSCSSQSRVGCCQQLRVSLAKSIALREEQERKRTLIKYIPDIARSLATVLNSTAMKRSLSSAEDEIDAKRRRVLEEVAHGNLSEDNIAQRLQRAVEKHDADVAMQQSLQDMSAKSSLPTQPVFLLPSSAFLDHPLPTDKRLISRNSPNAVDSQLAHNVSDDSGDMSVLMNSSLVSMESFMDGTQSSSQPTSTKHWYPISPATNVLILVPNLALQSKPA
jgi:DNA topoisomerase VI subunit B